jgi:ribonuclease HII
MSREDFIKVEIIDDSEDDEPKLSCGCHLEMDIKEKEVLVSTEKKELRAPRKKQQPLQKYYTEDKEVLEIGVDEVGRGPLFGRVYTAAVILPKEGTFDHSKLKDSKKFHSTKKIQEVATYIKENAIAWAVAYEDEQTIDTINILQATQSAMHKAIQEVRKQINKESNIYLLIDGNYFKPITILHNKTKKIDSIPFTCIEGGDNKYTPIAAASILAKVARDQYIQDLCLANPELVEYYDLGNNKGYGSKKHMEGIKQHGISIWHRRSFGICKEY